MYVENVNAFNRGIEQQYKMMKILSNLTTLTIKFVSALRAIPRRGCTGCHTAAGSDSGS